MKKTFLFLAFNFIGLTSFAQVWNYESQNMIYSTANTVSVGSAPQGTYGANDRSFEINSPTNFAVFALKAGTNSIQLINSTVYGNSFGLPNNAPFSFNMGGAPTNPTLRIQTNGNIAIGTVLNPVGYKLAVGGKIIAEELKVRLQSAPWPDYVFEKDYKLPTLAEVEKQIQDKGHLANVPSACEIETNGFEVGDMVRIQQQKIEELTLYIIELNKKLEAQEKKMQVLEAKINN